MAATFLTADDLHWLVCPACREPLRLEPDTSTILCLGCARLYPIVDGLPVLLASSAQAPFRTK